MIGFCALVFSGTSDKPDLTSFGVNSGMRSLTHSPQIAREGESTRSSHAFHQLRAIFRRENRVPTSFSWARLAPRGHFLAARHNDNYDHYKQNTCDDADCSRIHRSTLLKIYAARVSLRPLPHITELGTTF